MDKVAELLKDLPYRTDTVTRDTEAFFKRQDLIKAKLKSEELTPDDINTYNENDNPTNLYFCYTCDNISELVRPNFYKGSRVICFECEVI
jgi:hypothetical protein